jgi:hypothetical protein
MAKHPRKLEFSTLGQTTWNNTQRTRFLRNILHFFHLLTNKRRKNQTHVFAYIIQELHERGNQSAGIAR